MWCVCGVGVLWVGVCGCVSGVFVCEWVCVFSSVNYGEGPRGWEWGGI